MAKLVTTRATIKTPEKSSTKWNERFQRLLPWALLLLFLVVVLAVFESGRLFHGASREPKLFEAPDYRRRVNQYLQEVDEEISLRKMQMTIDNHKLAPPIADGLLQEKRILEPIAQDKDIEEDRWSEESLRATRTPSDQPNYARDIDDSVNLQVNLQRKQIEYDQLARRQFVQDYIAEANRNGYDIEVSNNLDVHVLGRRNPNSMDATLGKTETSGSAAQ